MSQNVENRTLKLNYGIQSQKSFLLYLKHFIPYTLFLFYNEKNIQCERSFQIYTSSNKSCQNVLQSKDIKS